MATTKEFLTITIDGTIKENLGKLAMRTGRSRSAATEHILKQITPVLMERKTGAISRNMIDAIDF